MAIVYSGQANILSIPVVNKETGAAITTGTVNVYLIAWNGVNAGKYFRGADSTWQSAKSSAGAATHQADGIWYLSVAAAAWTAGVAYEYWALESGDLNVPAPEDGLCVAPGSLLTEGVGTGRLCTVDDVKSRLGLTTSDHDTLLTRIVLGVESLFDNHTGHPLLQPDDDVTEYGTGRGGYLQLQRFPVIAITSIKESWDYDWDNVSALVADTDYRLLAGGVKGILYRRFMDWSEVPDSVQTIYRGGYCPAGSEPGTGETAVPADLRELAIEQCSFIFKRKDDIGLSAVSYEGGSISKFQSIDLLPIVKAGLEKYTRQVYA